MDDIYQLSLKENLFLAKKVLAQTIYDSSILEGIPVTFPQTETLVHGYSVAGVSTENTQKVLNMKHAWEYLFEHISEPLNLSFMNKINSFVSYNESLDWGVLRYGEVSISGTEYIPPIPTPEKIESDITDIFQSDLSDTEKGIELFLYGCKTQMYWDGNKRTSNIIANKYLIEKGRGVMSIPTTRLETFGTLLSRFYSTGEKQDLKQFIHEYAIQGITFIKKPEKGQNTDLPKMPHTTKNSGMSMK